MTARLLDQLFRVTDTNGVPLSGALLYVYEAGTTTPINTYSDSGLSSANVNPIVSDSAGYFGEVFVSADSYKWILKDAAGNTLETADDIEISAAPTLTLTETINAQTGTSYTLQTTDRAKLVTISNANAIALTLPQADASNFPAGWYTTIHNKGAGTATVTPVTSTLDGLATYTMRTGEMIRISSDGTNYQISMVGGKDPGVNAQTGTTYTMVTGDRDKLVTFNNAAAVTVTLAQANTTTFKNGWSTRVRNIGAGVVTITPTTSTIAEEATLVLTRGQEAVITSDGTNYHATITGEAVGNVKFGYSATAPQGYLLENGDTIGSAASGAIKAHARYEALYHYYWNNITDTYAAVSTGRGASAAADFAADKTLTIPDNDNRVPYGAGTSTTGETNGAATVAAAGTNGTTGSHTLTEAEMPSHTHGLKYVPSVSPNTNDFSAATGFGQNAASAIMDNRTASSTNSAPVATAGSAGGHAHPGSTFTGSATSVVQLGRVIYWYIKY